MEQKELEKTWQTVLGEIETEVSRANFITLFKKTVLVSFDEDTATIGVSSTMVIDLLQKRFMDLIKKTFDKQTKKDIKIIFVPKTINIEKNSEKNGPLFIEEEVKQTIGHLPRVRQDFTFQNLAVSSTNQLAYVSSQTVAKNLGKLYNPFFIYGPVGVGKTHLMQAIANEVYLKDPNIKVIYTTSEEFTNEVVEAIRTNSTSRMKRKFRSCNLLIIDDVQFLAGKDKVQEELFHTFNILIDSSAQIVLSSDRPPQEIKKLERRLSSRFSGGLTVDIESPDFELRCAILLIKAIKYEVDLPMDAAKIIAEKIEDVRNLEGVLLRVVTQAKSLGEKISTSFVESVLGNKEKLIKNKLHPDDVIKNVCNFYDIKPTLLKGPKRDSFLVKARQISMYLLKKELDLTFVEIGNILGGRDHTTIMHGVEKIETLMTSKPNLHEDIVGITKFLHE